MGGANPAFFFFFEEYVMKSLLCEMSLAVSYSVITLPSSLPLLALCPGSCRQEARQCIHPPPACPSPSGRAGGVPSCSHPEQPACALLESPAFQHSWFLHPSTLRTRISHCCEAVSAGAGGKKERKKKHNLPQSGFWLLSLTFCSQQAPGTSLSTPDN